MLQSEPPSGIMGAWHSTSRLHTWKIHFRSFAITRSWPKTRWRRSPMRSSPSRSTARRTPFPRPSSRRSRPAKRASGRFCGRTMPYQAIEDYGVIGGLRTAALIGTNGSVDWFCFPRFDSPSVFAAVLDHQKGGYFRIAPTLDEVPHKQLYWPDTNILVTRFLSAGGVGEVIDFMPIGASQDGGKNGSLIRRVRVLRGTVRFRLECCPAFNYALDTHTTRIVIDGAHFIRPGLQLGLKSPIRLEHSAAGVSAAFSMWEQKERG